MKMKKKYKKINLILTIIPVMIVVLLLIAGSYAIFSTDLNPTKIHTLTVGDLYAAKLSITDDGYVNLVNAVPLSNDLGMKGDPTNLTLENVGDLAATYSIILLDDKTEYANFNGSILPDSVIKYGITKNNNVNSTINLLSDATEYCSDNSIASYSTCKASTTAESGRVIMTGRLASGESVDYKLRLWINYIAGNIYQENRFYGQIKVIIGKDLEVDSNKPYIILNGNSEVTLIAGENYYEEGILAAIDKEDGDVSNTLSITNNVDITTPGIYKVSYSVYDSNNQYGFATRTVVVKSKTDCGITFTIVGDNPLSQLLGSTYSEQGATAVDSGNNSLTVTSNSLGVDVDTIGQYHVIYSATSGSCTDYAYRLVEVTIGSGGYITYTPNGTNNVWSSSNVTAAINIASDITGITPTSIKYKIGTYVNDNITYGSENTVLVSALPTTYTFSSSGKYIISTTLVTSTGLEIDNLLSQIYYVDKTPPSCGTPTYTSSPTITDPVTWISTNRTVAITSCQDSHSGCDGSTLSSIFSSTAETGTITISDKASPTPNTSTCTVNVYVDKTSPTCGKISNANTTWTKTLSNPISVVCNDTNSGCSSASFSSSFVGYTGRTGTITISDSSNPSNTASCSVNTYLDNSTPTAPTITATSNGSNYTSNTWSMYNVSISISGGSSISGLYTYQYCTSATNSSSNCDWSDGSSLNVTSNGTTYVFARYVNNAITAGTVTSAFIVKIDKESPACVLQVTTSGVSFASRTDNIAVSNYGMNTTGTVSYNSTTSLDLSTGTFYGYVKDAAGNTGSCSATLTSTYVTSYTRVTRTCGYTISGYSGTCGCSGKTTIYSSSEVCIQTCVGTCNGKLCYQDGVSLSCGGYSSCSARCSASGYPDSSGSCTAIRNYSFTSTTNSLTETCAVDNSFDCNSTNNGSSYIYSCAANDYACASGTKLNNTYCYVIN